MPNLPEQWHSITEEDSTAGSIDLQFSIPKSGVYFFVIKESIVNG